MVHRRPAAVVAAALLVVVACLVARPGTVAADEPTDPAAKAAIGDAAAVAASLADGYRKGTLDVWAARLYQDLRTEAGERAALRTETEAAFPAPRTGVAAYFAARVADRKDYETLLNRCFGAVDQPGAVMLDLGWNALATERLPVALALVPKVRRALPDHEEATLFDATVQRAQGNVEGAVRTLASFVASHPDAFEARRAWAHALAAAGRRPDALGVLDEGLKRMRAAPLLVARAAIFLEMRDLAAAQAALDEVKQTGRPALRAEAAALRAAVRLANRDVPGALTAVEEGLKISPVSAVALRAKARCQELAGRPAEALAALDAAIALRPGWAALYADRGAVYLRNRQVKEARKALTEAKRRDADDPAVALLLGALAEEDADWSVAEKLYRGILRNDPDHLDARRMLAGVILLLGRLDQADEEAQAVLAHDPKDAVSWFVRGRVAYRQDRWDEALAYFDKSIAADPTYPLPHCGKGWVYEQQDKLDDAKKSFEAAVAADPKMPLPHRDLAELLEELSDFGVAAKHYRLYLELGGADPDEDVKHAVERLSK